jgi:hypothetical protein
MLGGNVLRDLDLPSLVDTFAAYTESGRAALTKRLSEPLSDSAAILERQSELRTIRQRCRDAEPTVNSIRATLRETEPDVSSVANAAATPVIIAAIFCLERLCCCVPLS